MTEAEEYSWIMYATTLGIALLIAHHFFYGQPFLPSDEKKQSEQSAKLARRRRGYLNLVFVRHAECMHTAAAGTPSAVMRHAFSGKSSLGEIDSNVVQDPFHGPVSVQTISTHIEHPSSYPTLVFDHHHKFSEDAAIRRSVQCLTTSFAHDPVRKAEGNFKVLLHTPPPPPPQTQGPEDATPPLPPIRTFYEIMKPT